MRITFTHRRDGTVVACTTVQTNGGPITLCASANEATVRRVFDELGQRGYVLPQGQVGGIFDDIGKVVKKLAKAKLLQKVAKIYREVARNPILSAAVDLVPGVATARHAGEAAIQAAQSAQRLIQRAQRGERQAQQAVREVVRQASNGNSQALLAARTMRAVQRVNPTLAIPARRARPPALPPPGGYGSPDGAQTRYGFGEGSNYDRGLRALLAGECG